MAARGYLQHPTGEPAFPQRANRMPTPHPQMSPSYFLNLFYPTLFAMLVSLFSSVIAHWLVPPQKSTLRDVLHEALDSLQREMWEQVSGALPRREDAAGEVDSVEGGNLARPVEQARLLNRAEPGRSLPALTPLLRNLYNARRHSVTRAPLGPTAIRPFLTLLGTRIGRNAVARGAGREMHVEFVKGKSGASEGAFGESLPMMAGTMGRALSVCVWVVDDVYAWSPAGQREWNLPALLRRAGLGAREVKVPDTGGSIGSRERLRAIQSQLDTAVAAYQADLLLWLDTDVFAASAGTPRCPVARGSLADASARAVFEQRLAGKGIDKARMRRAHEARLKATSWLVAMLDVSCSLVVWHVADLGFSCRRISVNCSPSRINLSTRQTRVGLRKTVHGGAGSGCPGWADTG